MSGGIDPKGTEGCVNDANCWNVDLNNPVRVCLGHACDDYLESTAHKLWREKRDPETGEEIKNADEDYCDANPHMKPVILTDGTNCYHVDIGS
jgi:hypothetical protein